MKAKLIFRIFSILFLCFTNKLLFSQENYDGYILCIDNSNTGLQQINEYYYIPLNFSNNNFYDKATLEYKEDKLESKIRALGGMKIYKYIHDFENENCIENTKKDINYYSDVNTRLVYFHYHKAENFPNINNEYFLKKIKKDKFYLARIKFKGCELIDKDYLKYKILKIFVFEIDEIKPVDREVQKNIIKLIKE